MALFFLLLFLASGFYNLLLDWLPDRVPTTLYILGPVVVFALVVYFRTDQLRVALRFTILSFVVIAALNSGMLWQNNWIPSIIRIMTITGRP